MVGPDVSGDWVILAVVIKTQGRRGEVAVDPQTDVPDRFREKMQLSALGKDNARRSLIIEDLWPHKSFLVLKFEGVDTMTDAEALIGAELQVPINERASLEPGWTYLSDLVGCVVFDGSKEIGPIQDVQFGAGEAPLLIVKSESKLPYEIPFAEAFLEKLDLERKQVRMKLPEGLLEVNAPVAKEGKKKSLVDGR
jgi:16S rRNA processing protein RimM